MPATATKRKKVERAEPELPLTEQITKCIRARELGKKQYARADRLLDAVSKRMTPGEAIEYGGGRKVVLSDLFETKTTVFKPLGFRRFELKVIEPT